MAIACDGDNKITLTTIVNEVNTHTALTSEHLDWTTDLGAINIHTGNYVNTTYDNTDFVDLTSTQSVGGAKTFTSPVGITIVTTENNSIAFNSGNNLSFTASTSTIVVTNQTSGRGGTLVIASADNITGWGTEFDWGYQGVPTDLTGTETFGYFISDASGIDSIKIGRV